MTTPKCLSYSELQPYKRKKLPMTYGKISKFKDTQLDEYNIRQQMSFSKFPLLAPQKTSISQ